MSNNHIVETARPTSYPQAMGFDTKEKDGIAISTETASDSVEHRSDIASDDSPVNDVPLRWKLASIILVSMIGFGSHWSSGITGAMKSTIKKQMKISTLR